MGFSTVPTASVRRVLKWLLASVLAAVLLVASTLGWSWYVTRAEVDRIWEPYRTAIVRPELWTLYQYEYDFDDWWFDIHDFGPGKLLDMPFWGANYCSIHNIGSAWGNTGADWACHGITLRFSLRGELLPKSERRVPLIGAGVQLR